ncbi:MAG: cyclic nucleotide-binding domain-containing protein [Thermodesulfobacteriota bacterium]
MPKVIKSNLIREDTIELLHKFQILNTLTREEIKLLLGKEGDDYHQRIAKLLQFTEKEIAVKEGEFDSWAFWVVKGEFAVIKQDIIVAVFNQPGEVFGEMSILAGDSRSATVAALTSGVCLSIDMSILDTIDNRNIKLKIQDGIQQLKSERLNLTTIKLAAEKKRVLDQLSDLSFERKRLGDKEKELHVREEKLSAREKRLEQQGKD